MKISVQELPPRVVIWGLAKVPLGNVVVGMSEEGEVCRISFLRDWNAVQVVEKWQREWEHTHFEAGKVPKSFLKLPLREVGTEFQRIIWLEIMQVPKGKVVSYGEIAERIGAGGRARAVGRACKMSSLAYVVPCHRVVSAKGLGGFGLDGTDFKEELLKLEGVILGKRR